MIDRIVISGYRIFRSLDMQPAKSMNIIVGDNEAGKSTLLEAIGMALTCRVNGRWARDELNPHWFNRAMVEEFFEAREAGEPTPAPEISIELFLANDVDALQTMCGANNSLRERAPGLGVYIKPTREYAEELEAYVSSLDRPRIVPVEYYDIEWMNFADQQVKRRPKDVAVSVIDSRTIRSTSGIDYHTREVLAGLVEPRERAAISVAHRQARHDLTEATLAKVNDRIAEETGALHDRRIGFQMDQSSSAAWETGKLMQKPLSSDVGTSGV